MTKCTLGRDSNFFVALDGRRDHNPALMRIFCFNLASPFAPSKCRVIVRLFFPLRVYGFGSETHDVVEKVLQYKFCVYVCFKKFPEGKAVRTALF